ncbi:hypothetical protein DsansV1_C04g0038911 [Dioscorea sansibarensis]
MLIEFRFCGCGPFVRVSSSLHRVQDMTTLVQVNFHRKVAQLCSHCEYGLEHIECPLGLGIHYFYLLRNIWH